MIFLQRKEKFRNFCLSIAQVKLRSIVLFFRRYCSKLSFLHSFVIVVGASFYICLCCFTSRLEEDYYNGGNNLHIRMEEIKCIAN
jgi:hypothetical protein